MNASELANKMLAWECLKMDLDRLGADIEKAVLEIGKTQTVGNVCAPYSAGRKKYDDRRRRRGYQVPTRRRLRAHSLP